jgi:8-amino-7-oxononanoate synthase
VLPQWVLLRRRRTVDSHCAPRTDADGAALLAFCSNDYLGLASHPAIVAALQEGAARYGAGSGASHLVSGHSIAHARLEARMAALQGEHIPEADALFFCTGYMANLAVVSAMAQAGGIRPAEECTIFSDALNHASLIDGARLSRAPIKVYPHVDLAALEALLAASTSRNKLIVTDGVFSMDGDIAPLPELLALAERYDAWLIVDDAHGLGVLGENGAGVLSHFGLHSQRIIYVGTFGKAAGGSGAAIVGHRLVIDWLVQRARTYIFTTATPPGIACAVEAALDLIASEEGDERRARLEVPQLDFLIGLFLVLGRRLDHFLGFGRVLGVFVAKQVGRDGV